MQVLTGHNSPETAYVIDDYPYGFTLRCMMRCWIETTRHGQRYVTQTSNPKRAGIVWNKPKSSTYSDIVVMFQDENGHVHNDGFSITYRDEADLDAFIEKYGEALQDERNQNMIDTARAIFRARKYVTVKIVSPEEKQTPEEEKEVMDHARRAVIHEYRKLKSE